jgi:hypothetical protein
MDRWESILAASKEASSFSFSKRAIIKRTGGADPEAEPS